LILFLACLDLERLRFGNGILFSS